MLHVDYSVVCPKKLKQYLVDAGWIKETLFNDHAVIMKLPTTSIEHFVLVPLTNGVGDYESRLWDLFSTLETIEQRHRSIIIADIDKYEESNQIPEI